MDYSQDPLSYIVHCLNRKTLRIQYDRFSTFRGRLSAEGVLTAAGQCAVASEHGTAAEHGTASEVERGTAATASALGTFGGDGMETCARCLACSRDKVALWLHVRAVHGDDASLRCQVAGCGRRFSTVFASAAHRTHHRVTRGRGRTSATYTCELCGHLSADLSAFGAHVAYEHRDARDAMCGACGRYAGDVRSLADHARAAHGVLVWPDVERMSARLLDGGDGDGAVGAAAGPERTRVRDVRYAPYSRDGKWSCGNGGNQWQVTRMRHRRPRSSTMV